MAPQRHATIDGVLVPGLRAVRHARALSQEDLAARAGVGRKTVMRGEGGKEIRLSSVRRLAAALGVTPRRLQQPPPASH
jgi:transcriptional regulator with XRE-family HTH domain